MKYVLIPENILSLAEKERQEIWKQAEFLDYIPNTYWIYKITNRRWRTITLPRFIVKLLKKT